MSDWRRSPKVAVVAIVLFAIIQFLVPLTRLGEHDRAQRFGWQMFTTAEPPPEFVVTTDLDEFAISLSDYMARPRADLDIVGTMPAHLCDVIPGAVSIRWEGGGLDC